MSILDELSDLQDRLLRRLHELAPLAAEYVELRAAALRVGIDASELPPAFDGTTDRPVDRDELRPNATAEATGQLEETVPRPAKTAATRPRRAAAAAAPSRPPIADAESDSDAPRAALAVVSRYSDVARSRAGGEPTRAGGEHTTVERQTRADQVLALITQQPGITVPELGKALRVQPTGLYRVVNKLEAAGLVEKDGRAWRPTGAATNV